MRLIAEIVIFSALLAVCWEKSLKERVMGPSAETAVKAKAPSALGGRNRQAVVEPAATLTPSGAWMWDKNRRSPLDPPTPKTEKAEKPEKP